MAFSGFGMTSGERVMDSTPPATTSEASPTWIARLACITASRPEPQRRLTVLPGTLVGQPADAAAAPARAARAAEGHLAHCGRTEAVAGHEGLEDARGQAVLKALVT